MSHLSKLIIISLIICLGLGISAIALAQDITEPTDETIAEEEVLPEDLETEEPKLLPDSPFYFVKEWGRAIQAFFSFGQMKKMELQQKFANERLLELKVMVEAGEISQEVLEKATEKYEKSMEKVKNKAEKIKENAEQNEEIGKFLDKFTEQQLLHQKILEKLEKQVPEEVFEKIKEARENHLEKFEQVMNKLENREQERNKIQEEAQEKIQERIRERIQERECRMLWWYDNENQQCQQKKFCGMFMYYGLKTFGNEEDCKKDLDLEEGGQITGACITLWDPICGKDGKTYSNECFAEQSEIEVDYKGECQNQEKNTIKEIIQGLFPIKTQLKNQKKNE